MDSLSALLSKEWRLELRRLSVLSGLGLYLVSVVFIIYLTFALRQNLITPPVWSALFWIAMLFTIMNSVAKSFIGERIGRDIYYYSIASPGSIIFSKIIYNFLLCSFMSAAGLLLFTAFLGSPISDITLFATLIFLAALAFSGSLTLLSAIASRTSAAHVVMAVMGFPVIISILLIAVRVTRRAIDGLDRSLSLNDLLMLGAINCIVVAMSYLLFPYIWRS